MSACVGQDDSFFGKCGVWTLSWAETLIAHCPQSIVPTQDGTPVAFFELKPIEPAAPARERFARLLGAPKR